MLKAGVEAYDERGRYQLLLEKLERSSHRSIERFEDVLEYRGMPLGRCFGNATTEQVVCSGKISAGSDDHRGGACRFRAGRSHWKVKDPYMSSLSCFPAGIKVGNMHTML